MYRERILPSLRMAESQTVDCRKLKNMVHACADLLLNLLQLSGATLAMARAQPYKPAAIRRVEIKSVQQWRSPRWGVSLLPRGSASP